MNPKNEEYQMEYKLIRGFSLRINEFETAVNQAIKEGWKPVGGVSFDGGRCYQVMIRG